MAFQRSLIPRLKGAGFINSSRPVGTNAAVAQPPARKASGLESGKFYGKIFRLSFGESKGS